MALSGIHDIANHGHAVKYNTLERVVIGEEKHFRPNPDAKPFFPNPVALTGNVQFINDKNLNGVVPGFWISQNPEHHENLVVGPASASNLLKKQHIAFHLVSNLLDDELPEEKENINAGFPNSPRPNMYDQGNERNQGWQTHTEPLNLPLEMMVKASAENNSINNKSIHEIWSPDPSPNGLSSISPTEEMNSFVPQQSPQSQQQPSEMIEHQEIESPEQCVPVQQTTPYSNIYEEGDNGPTSPSQFFYPPPPIYHQPYVYRGKAPSSAHRVPPEMYPAPVHQNRENILPRPFVLGPGNGFFGPPSHYNNNENNSSNKYPHHHQPHPHDEGSKYRPRHHKQHQQSTYHTNTCHSNHHHHRLEVSYEVRMSYLEELGIALDECRDQLRHLEKDYKKADVTLSRDFRLRKSSSGDIPSNKYPPNSTRVDKLISDELKEHQKIESLIGRIERLGFTPMHPNVGVTLDSWLASIKDLRNTRKNEMASLVDTHNNIHYGSKSLAQTDVCNLIKCVKDVTKHTRSARTVVWCAMQMLYANTTSNSASGD